MRHLKRLVVALTVFAIMITGPNAIKSSYAMSLHDAVSIIHKYGNKDISVVRRISPPLASKVQGGWDSIYHWCDDNDTNRVVCISVAVTLAASE